MLAPAAAASLLVLAEITTCFAQPATSPGPASTPAPPAAPGAPAQPDEPKPGDRSGPPQVERPVPKQKIIPDIGPVRDVRRVGWGYRAADGPVADAAGNLFFTDALEQRIYRLDVNGTVTTFMENTGGAIALDFLADGRFVATFARDHKIAAIDPATKSIDTLTDTYNGAPLIRPADLTVDSFGGIYFTDTGGKGTGLVGPGEPLRAVFYLAPADSAGARAVTLLVNDRASPNGIHLSPDGKTLWVLPSVENGLFSYAVEGPGKIGAAAKVCELRASDGRGVRGGDGMTRDVLGNMYLAIPNALLVQVVSPSGEILGRFTFPDKPSNCTFGGKDFKNLYVTAQKSLYEIPLAVEGERPRYSAKQN